MKKILLFILMFIVLVGLTIVLARCTPPQKTLLKCNDNGLISFAGTVTNTVYFVKTDNCAGKGSMAIFYMPPVDSTLYVSPMNKYAVKICGYHEIAVGDSVWLQHFHVSSKFYWNEYICIDDYKYKILK